MTQITDIRLAASDGHAFAAAEALPAGTPRGGIVLIQEVFGVNHHIRAVVAQYAEAGYAVVAPALFDRAARDTTLGYNEADLARGRELRMQIGWDGPVLDVSAALAHLAPHGRTGVIGYCWGGSVAFLSATRLSPNAAVCYYGGQIIQFKDEAAKAPVQMHFGERDTIITPDDVAAIRAAQPDADIHVYPAGHGFNCTERADYDPESARTALERTLAFLQRHVG